MLTKSSKKIGSLGSLLIFLGSLTSCNGIITKAQNNKSNEINQLETVKQRGYLNCGISGEIPGFSFVDFTGQYAGMDVDFCKAVAAALFNDPSKIKFHELSVDERFDALQSGKIDLLSRNTTQTLSRDTSQNIEFTPPIFYDAQGIMVNRASGIESVADLAGKSICVAKGTTSYNNLQDYMTQEGIKYTPLAMDDREELYSSYEHNRCQAITADTSQLVARKILLANPQDHQVLAEKIGQEPLAPAVVHQDSQWFDVIKWVTFALIQAEELNINSNNLSIHKNSQDSEVRRFLGKDSNLGTQMGLSDDFALRIIKHVGNYQEIYDRNVGEPFGLPRGQNALWQNGGLMYSPPFN